MSATEQIPLLGKEEPYYGKNDWTPFRSWSCGKRVGVIILVIIISPLILLWMILMPFFMYCFPMKKGQEATSKVLLYEFLNKAPGMKLDVKASGENTSDVIISSKLVDKEGFLHPCGGLGWSLRKSIEHTVEDHSQNGPHGANIRNDLDVDKPRYFLNGSTHPYDPNFDEVWCGSGLIAQWPAVYCWSPQLPAGVFTGGQAICLKDAPDVFGYIFLFEVTNKEFYNTDRIVKVGRSCVNCPEITPENEGKLFARYGYDKAKEFGNLDVAKEPDAYILKGKALKDAQIKLVHTYRIMKPAMAVP